MKRMIPQALIDWVKSLFTRIHPGDRDGDIEIGGNVEVDGYFYPEIRIRPYAGAFGGVTVKIGSSGSYNILEFVGDYYEDPLKPRVFSAGQYDRYWVSGQKDGYANNAQILALYNSDSDTWAGVGVTGRDTSGASSYSYLDVGFAQHYKSYSEQDNYLILNTRIEVKACDTYLYNVFEPSALKSTIKLTTSPEGTGSLVSERIEKNETYIAGHNTLHFNLTEGAGTATSGQVTFTGTGLDTSIKATGVLLKANVLVGVCYLMVNSATEAALYYQNPLGLDLAAGDYTANLQLEASN